MVPFKVEIVLTFLVALRFEDFSIFDVIFIFDVLIIFDVVFIIEVI